MLTDEDLKKIEELCDRKLEWLANTIVEKLYRRDEAKLDIQYKDNPLNFMLYTYD